MSNPLIVFHDPCSDGITACWIAYNFFEEEEQTEAELLPTNYNTIIDLEKFIDREVYILDFSFKRHILEKICEVAKHVTVLDHHKTAEQELKDFNFENSTIIFDMNKSGAMLTWEYFYADIESPILVKYVQDRDLWKWELPLSRDINTAIASYSFTIGDWDKLMRRDHMELYDEGFAIGRYKEKQIGLHEQNVKYISFADHDNVPLVNCTTHDFKSELGGRLARDAAFSIVWHQGSDNMIYLSFRSNKNALEPIDVSEIAKALGGGGHANASGAVITKEEFENINKTEEVPAQ